MSDASAKYVYGVVPADAPVSASRGIRSRRVKKIGFEELAAIVSDVPTGELEVHKDDLIAHSRVLERALQGGAVIPLRFGTVMEDSASVRDELLERFHDRLLRQLEELDGRAELHLRAVYEESALMAQVVASHPQIARLRDDLADTPPDASYYERIRLGEMVAEAVERTREQDLARILDALAPLAVATDVGPVEHEQVAASIAFLVEVDALATFDAAVDELGRLGQGRLRFKYTGPLPAYSFVEHAAEV